MWELAPELRFYIQTVHRLTDRGAVCSHAAHDVSHSGFDAEWRGIELMTVDQNVVNRCEIVDDADLDAALAKFDELSQT
ncbi:hypothetical protein AWC19_27155 [Mycobacterium palustre]|uniref:Uncharacterized protein n=1 Tax=Mycobacterium palustre TaxID=153971 RepID=A0A1X1ZWZ8_9MYCO|nr:hypothetical protein AWC19_27155 [Mycobacterium palustre]